MCKLIIVKSNKVLRENSAMRKRMRGRWLDQLKGDSKSNYCKFIKLHCTLNFKNIIFMTNFRFLMSLFIIVSDEITDDICAE